MTSLAIFIDCLLTANCPEKRQIKEKVRDKFKIIVYKIRTVYPGKYHCTADLLFFVWIQLLCLCWISNKFTCLVESNQSNRRSAKLSPYGECSLIWLSIELPFKYNDADEMGIFGLNFGEMEVWVLAFATKRATMVTVLFLYGPTQITFCLLH